MMLKKVLLLSLSATLIGSCTDTSTNRKIDIDSRFSEEKREELKQQFEIAELKIKKSSTYLFDCQSDAPEANAILIEEVEYDKDGRVLKSAEYHYTGRPRSATRHFYGPDGNKTYQNLYNDSDAVIQTKYFDQLGYDTLTRNFMEGGAIRNEMHKNVIVNDQGYPVKVEEKDHLGRLNTVVTYSYNDDLDLTEESFTRYNLIGGDEVGTQVIQYNTHGDRQYMSSSANGVIEDEVSMEYEYNGFDKIENARLLNKDGLLIREKVNSFYSSGEPKHILETRYDPLTGEATQTYEENYSDNGKLLSFYLKDRNGAIVKSGEYTYDGKLLLETIEFDQSQNPAYLCTFVRYEFYN